MTINSYALPHAIGELPEYLRNLTFSISSSLNVDVGMTLTTLLSGMAAGVHGLKSVELPGGGVEPLALFYFILAGPTTGKTRTHELVHAPHNAQDLLGYEEYQAAKKTGADVRLRDVIQAHTNGRGLLEGLEGVGHATAISVHEGSSVLSSYFFWRQLDIANVLWDRNHKVTLPRSNGGRVIAFNASLNLLVMVQPDIFREYLTKHGDMARGIGFLPRCLFTILPHLGPPVCAPHVEPGNYLDECYKDVTAFLEAHREKQEAGNSEREVIRFSPSAKQLWFQLEHEHKQCSGFQLFSSQDARNRAMQNVARLAGVIHSYYPRRLDDSRLRTIKEEDLCRIDEISTGTLKAAWALVQWHLGEFATVFPPMPIAAVAQPKLSALEKREKQIVEDAETIMFHFNLHCRQTRDSDAPKSAVVTRSGLYQLRFNAAQFYLTDEGYLVEEGGGKKTRLRLGQRAYVPLKMLNQGWGASTAHAI